MKAEAVRDHYEKFNLAYQEAYGPVLQACRAPHLGDMLSHIGDQAGIKKGQRVLDCGGGFGLPAAFFAKHFGADVVSLNITESQLQEARNNYPYVDHRKFNFDQMSDLVERFDCILFLETLGHTSDISTLFEKIYGRLKPGGLVFIKHPCALNRTVDRVRELEKFYHYSFFTVATVMQRALGAHFILESARVTPYGVYDETLVSNFSKHTDGAKVFVTPEEPAFSQLKYYDFIFKRGE